VTEKTVEVFFSEEKKQKIWLFLRFGVMPWFMGERSKDPHQTA